MCTCLSSSLAFGAETAKKNAVSLTMPYQCGFISLSSVIANVKDFYGKIRIMFHIKTLFYDGRCDSVSVRSTGQTKRFTPAKAAFFAAIPVIADDRRDLGVHGDARCYVFSSLYRRFLRLISYRHPFHKRYRKAP